MLETKIKIWQLLIFQLVLDFVIYFYTTSWFCLIFGIIVTIFSTMVCYFHRRNKNVKTNLFYPQGLLSNTLWSAIILSLIAISPVIIGYFEAVFRNSFHYDNSLKNILLHICYNLLGMVAGLGIILVIKSTMGAKEYISSGFRNQDNISVILLNVSYLGFVFYNKQEQGIRANQFSYNNAHVWANSLWLVIIYYLVLSSMVFLYHFVYTSKSKGNKVVLSGQILVMIELAYFHLFSLGIFNESTSLTYSIFLASTPIVILGNWLLMSAFKYQLKDRRYGEYAHKSDYASSLDTRFFFTLFNFLIFILIISLKTGLYYLFVPGGFGIVAIVSVFFVNFNRNNSLTSRSKNLLKHLSTLADSEGIEQTKAYLYHHFKKRDHRELVWNNQDVFENAYERHVQENFEKELARLEKYYYQ